MNELKEKAKKAYIEGIGPKEISETYNIKINTLKSWIKRDKWKSLRDKGAPRKKKGAPLNNKNAVGNSGGAAPKKNKNAEKHGFFSKYLPEETLQVIKDIGTKNPLDILWENIQIQYAAIIRAQRIMYVRDKKDKTIERVEEKRGKVQGERWEVQQAWDKQATFLQAQSRAMAELRNMIKQYDELLNANRDLATQEQKLRIEKLKTEVDALKGGSSSNAHKAINEFIEATTVKPTKVKSLFEGEEDENIQE